MYWTDFLFKHLSLKMKLTQVRTTSDLSNEVNSLSVGLTDSLG